MKTCIIVNAKSGTGQASSILKNVKSALEEKFGHCKIIENLLSKNDPQIKTSLEDGYERFIVIGGDGTLHRTINLMTPLLLKNKGKPIELGLISTGTGCDFSRNFHKQVTIENELAAILRGNNLPLDVGSATLDDQEPIYFINSLSIGIGGEALARMTSWHKNYLPTKLSYLIPGIMAFLAYQPQPYKLFADNKSVNAEHSLGIMVYNGQYSGGGMRWSKKANVSDGRLQLLVLPVIQKNNLAPAVIKILTDRIDQISGFQDISTTAVNVSLSSGANFNVEMDGELFTSKSVTVRVRSGLFKFLA